jgi:hypothetical protein
VAFCDLVETQLIAPLLDEHFSEKADVSHLAEGIYLVRIYTEGVPATKKIIIKR